MKENAWNKSRITPTITNFLVLMFSIIAPAMANETGWGGNAVTASEKTVANVGCWRREEEMQSVSGGGEGRGDESVASTAGRE